MKGGGRGRGVGRATPTPRDDFRGAESETQVYKTSFAGKAKKLKQTEK